MPAIYVKQSDSLDDAIKKFKSKNKDKIEEYKGKTAYISKPEAKRKKARLANKKRTKSQNKGF